MKTIMILIASLAAIASTQMEPVIVYVKSADTKILSQPSGKSKTLYKAKAGEPLKVLEKEGKYYRVETKHGKTKKEIVGYVFKLRVTTKKPDSTSGASAEDLFGDKKIGKRSDAMDEESSSHSIRGREKAEPEKKK